MDQLRKEHDRLANKTNLGKAIDDVQILVDQLKKAKAAVTQRPQAAVDILEAQIKHASTQLDKVNVDLKEIYSGLGKYGKALEKKFKDRPLPFADQDALAGHTDLVNRAIAMHLLREGHFDVAATFMAEANASTNSLASSAMDVDRGSNVIENHMVLADQLLQPSSQARNISPPFGISSESDSNATVRQPDSLHQQFQEMYSILNSLRQHSDLAPAIAWARNHSALLEARGSNLEYDLCQLQYITMFKNGTPGPATALAYARQTFSQCPQRYAPQIQRLVGALAFLPNLDCSPYAELFGTGDNDPTTAAASAFTAEFCALLSLSSASPLFTAVTAGCIALPTLLKLSQIQASHRTSWTTASELPVEVPLPPAYKFHSIFVCPVSKEQSTDANPPMMMPCFHVICKDSLDRVSRGGRFKCPYCPAESHKNEAKRVFV